MSEPEATTESVIESLTGDPTFDTMSSVDVPGIETPNDLTIIESPEETIPVEGEGEQTPTESPPEAETPKEEVVIPVESKIAKAVLGDKQIDIPENAVLKVKVDGTEYDVSVADLKKNYSGKIPLDKHFRESKEYRKQLEGYEQKLKSFEQSANAKVEEILSTFEKNPYLAFEKIAEWKGENPAKYLPYYIAQSKKTIEQLETLSKAEQEALILNRKVQYEEKALEKKAKDLEDREKYHATQREIEAAEGYFANLASTHGFSEEEVAKGQELVRDSGTDLSKVSPKETADLLAKAIQVDRRFTAIESAVDSVNPTLRRDPQFMNNLSSLITSDLTKNDILDIVKAYVGELTPAKKDTKNLSSSSVTTSQGQQKIKPKAFSQNGTRKEEGQEVRVGSNGSKKDYMSINDILSDYN